MENVECNKKVKTFLIYFLIFISGGIFTGVFELVTKIDIDGDNHINKNEEFRLKENYKFINPLLECDSTISESLPTNKLKEKLVLYIKNKKDSGVVSDVAVYYRDLNNGPWFGINERTQFSPASLIKVPLMIVYYQMAESDPQILQTKILNSQNVENIYNQQDFNVHNKLERDKEYTIEELIQRMIIYSDNVAYNLLFEKLDNNLLKKVYEDLGVDISQAYQDPNGNIISIKDYASFYRILFNASYLSKNYSEKALELLSKTDFNQGLVAGIPKEISVAHKYGERDYVETSEKQMHDCGIVYKPNKPYLVCVMTKGTNFNLLTNVIKDISSQIYNYGN